MKIRFNQFFLLSGFLACISCGQNPTDTKSIKGAEGIDRTVLPIKEPLRERYKELDVRNTTPPPRFEVKAPKDAPNVVVILYG